MLDISNTIAAFSEEQVQKLTNLTIGRLRYWHKTGFFSPTFVEENPRLPYSKFYSFRDVVALRTLEMLRVQNGVPLQHLRKVAEKLSHLRDDLWTKTTLFVVNKKVAFANPEIGKSEEVLSGQYLLSIPLRKVMDDTSIDVAQMRLRKSSEIGSIARRRNVCHNAWVVEGTRIPVASIKRLSEDGYNTQQIIDEYPDLTAADVAAALAHSEQQAA